MACARAPDAEHVASAVKEEPATVEDELKAAKKVIEKLNEDDTFWCKKVSVVTKKRGGFGLSVIQIGTRILFAKKSIRSHCPLGGGFCTYFLKFPKKKKLSGMSGMSVCVCGAYRYFHALGGDAGAKCHPKVLSGPVFFLPVRGGLQKTHMPTL